ncbi:MAG: hypothetical protein OXC26_24150 [Albidovulum sp.]|nr:hypothetical protein [Albidovulum sp.]
MNFALLTTAVLILLCLLVALWFIVRFLYRWIRNVSIDAKKWLEAKKEGIADERGGLGCLPFSVTFIAGIVFAIIVIVSILSGLGFELIIGIFRLPAGLLG